MLYNVETTRLKLSRPTTADTLILCNLWRNEQVRQYLEKIGMQHTNTLWRWNAAQRFYELTRTEWLAFTLVFD